jgi:hypothetical protein
MQNLNTSECKVFRVETLHVGKLHHCLHVWICFQIVLKLTNLFLNFANKPDPGDLLPFEFLDSHFLMLMSYLLIVSWKIGENYLYPEIFDAL